MLNFLKAHFFTLFWSILVMFLCFYQFSNEPSVDGFLFFEGFDKLVHLVIFQTLVFLAINGIEYQYNLKKLSYTQLVLIFFLVSIFAGFTEIMQTYIFTYRSGNWLDFIVDELGILITISQYVFTKIVQKL